MTRIMTPESPRLVRPPRWADAVLRSLLPPGQAETVSGDLLEAYRDSVFPSRGREEADRWFLRQVAGFAWRATWVWALLLAMLTVGRDALDWFVPPADFRFRSIITTYAAMAIFVACGGLAAYRTRSLRASALAGFTTGAIGGVMKIAGVLPVLALIAFRQDPATSGAIDYAGGLDEVFVLPAFILLPGVLLATLGGVLGKTTAWVVGPRHTG